MAGLLGITGSRAWHGSRFQKVSGPSKLQIVDGKVIFKVSLFWKLFVGG
jgi:hypothetical protein